MIRLDYLDHPLVIKSLRVKYRGGRLAMLAGCYVLLLLAGLMIMQRFSLDVGGPMWIRNYFIGMISLQMLISAVIAMSATASSMQSKVTSRTLDLQRIAGLSPAQIILGKAFGEPTSAYLFSLVTIPIAAICCTIGGVNIFIAVLMYLTLATTTFMMACLGLLNHLDSAKKSDGASRGMLVVVLVPVLIAQTSMAGTTGFHRGITAAIGLLTPAPAIRAMIVPNNPTGWNAWSAGLPFFDTQVPFLILTSLVQLTVSACVIFTMARRLAAVTQTSLSKVMTYSLLIVDDVLWTGLYFDTIQTGADLTANAILFAAVHSVFVLILSMLATPDRESYLSWIWRFRSRTGPLRDLIIGERTLNTLSLAVGWLVGLVVYCLGTLIPLSFIRPGTLSGAHWLTMMITFTASLLLIFSSGLFYQLLCVAGGKKGAVVILFIFLTSMIAGPFFAGEYFKLPILSHLSPIGLFSQLDNNRWSYETLAPFVGMHLFFIRFWSWGLFRITWGLKHQVDRKLRTMRSDETVSTAHG